jgi:putative GTP pyrophosphokinase
MAPRSADPFKPPAQVSYSKSEVNRAGQLVRAFSLQPDEQYERDPWVNFDRSEVFDAMYKVTWWRTEHARPLKKVAANLQYHVRAEAALVGGRVDVSQRLKRRATIIGKLDREPKMDLTRMADIGGVRARLPTLRDLNAVSRRLKKTWTVVRTRDYIASPKRSGYRALHHVVKRDGRLIEVQLRTVLQDAWANQVEEDGRQLGVGFKFGAGDSEVHDYYRVVAAVFAVIDQGDEIPDLLASSLNQKFGRVRLQLRRQNETS